MQLVATGQLALPLRAWASLRLLLWYFGSQFGFAVLILLVPAIYPVFLGEPPDDLSTEQFLVAFAAATVCAGLVILFRLRRNLPGGAWPAVLAALGWRPVRRQDILLWAAIGGCLAYAFVHLVMLRLRPPTSQDLSSFNELLTTDSLVGRLILLVIAVAVAPLLEEFVFRGILLTGLGNSWGVLPGVFGSTAFFALAHLDQVGSYWPAFAGVMGVALVAAFVRLRYRSLYPGIALHVAYNATVMAISFSAA